MGVVRTTGDAGSSIADVEDALLVVKSGGRSSSSSLGIARCASCVLGGP